MITVLPHKPEYSETSDFISDLNKARLAYKNQWIVYVGTVNNHSVRIKSFNTGYLQICEIDGIDHGGAMDMNVTEWKNEICKGLGA